MMWFWTRTSSREFGCRQTKTHTFFLSHSYCICYNHEFRILRNFIDVGAILHIPSYLYACIRRTVVGALIPHTKTSKSCLYMTDKNAGWTETDVRKQYAIDFHRHSFDHFVILNMLCMKATNCIFLVSMCVRIEQGCTCRASQNYFTLCKCFFLYCKTQHPSDQLIHRIRFNLSTQLEQSRNFALIRQKETVHYTRIIAQFKVLFYFVPNKFEMQICCNLKIIINKGKCISTAANTLVERLIGIYFVGDAATSCEF